MLTERFDASTLPDPGAWHPYPTMRERAFWDGLPAVSRAAWLTRAEAAVEAEWPALPATLWLDFVRTGQRYNWEAPMFTRRLRLLERTVGALVDGTDRFADPIADAVWSICEESAWNFPAHMHEQRAGSGLPDVEEPTVELGVGESAASIAWTSYLVGDLLDTVSPLVRHRIAHECRRRLLQVFLDRDDFHWQSAVNNWVPWLCCNIVSTAMLVEEDRPFRDAVVTKAVAHLDRFVGHYPADGGCDEGPTYWTRAGGMLFSALELLHSATGGALDVYGEPLISAIGRYVHTMAIAGDWFVNFADGGPQVHLPGTTALRYGRAIGDVGLERLGLAHAHRNARADPKFLDGFTNLLPMLPDLPALLDMDEPPPVPLVRDAELPDIQVLVARDEADSTDGWFLAVKGGHNDEAHNHNDVGSVVVFLDGRPLLVDAGVGPYTRATFSHERYTIWTMQSGWHSVPTINGVEQRAGKSAKARDWTTSVGDAATSVSVDIAGAYPDGCGAERWVRSARLVRGTGVDLVETWAFGDGVAEGEGRATLHLLSAVEPSVVMDGGVVRLAGAAAVVVEAPDGVTVDMDVVRRDLEEPNLKFVWDDTLWRIDIALGALPRTGTAAVHLRRP